MERKNVVISTDGACSGNPGPGGFAAVLRFGNLCKEVVGHEVPSTNNRAELNAVIIGMAALKIPCTITVRTDSQVVCNAIANLDGMPKTGWKTKTGALRSNLDLLQKMLKIKQEGNHELYYQYIPGHSGDADNERCNFLAQEQARLHKR